MVRFRNVSLGRVALAGTEGSQDPHSLDQLNFGKVPEYLHIHQKFMRKTAQKKTRQRACLHH